MAFRSPNDPVLVVIGEQDEAMTFDDWLALVAKDEPTDVDADRRRDHPRDPRARRRLIPVDLDASAGVEISLGTPAARRYRNDGYGTFSGGHGTRRAAFAGQAGSL